MNVLLLLPSTSWTQSEALSMSSHDFDIFRQAPQFPDLWALRITLLSLSVSIKVLNVVSFS